MKTIVYLLTTFFVILLTVPSYAADTDPLYSVEVIIFSNELNAYKQEEQWPKTYTAEAPTQFLTLASNGTQATTPELVTPTATENNAVMQKVTTSALAIMDDSAQLNEIAKKIQRTSRHRLLFHHTWLQAIADKEHALPLLIQAGEKLDNYDEVAGFITLYRGRYLHISTQLWKIIRDNSDEAVVSNIQIPNFTNLVGLTVADTDEQENNLVITDNVFIAPLQQDRRMRSNEIHYIDHPLFGLIIEIRPYTNDATTDDAESL